MTFICLRKMESGRYKELGSSRAANPLGTPRGVLLGSIPRPVCSRHWRCFQRTGERGADGV